MRKTISIITALLALLALGACSTVTEPDQASYDQDGGKLTIAVKPGDTVTKAIGTQEFTVNKLTIQVKCIANDHVVQTLTWYPGNGEQSYNLTIGYPGEYLVTVTHYGSNNTGNISQTETATVEVRPMLISSITIIPGYIGSIAVTTDAVTYIKNGDFLDNTTPGVYPNYWVAKYSNQSAGSNFWYESFAGRNGVVNLSSSSGIGVRQIAYPAIPIEDTLTLTVRFRIDSASLVGDGWYPVSPEAPVVVFVTFSKPGSGNYVFKRYYNYTHDDNSASNPNFELVSRYAWTTKTYTTTAMGVPAGYNFKDIQVFSNGWSRTSYVDLVTLQ